MAKRKKKNLRKELWAGVATLSVVLALLLSLAVSLQEIVPTPEQTDPPQTTAETTLPTEATLPEPQSNPYGPMDFQYDGIYLTCAAGPSTLGIDVSSHQGDIDWQQVAETGIEFVMIRVGNRGYKYGQITADEYAQINYSGAKAAGLKIGVYFFSQAVDPTEALEEAAFVLEQIEGWELELPVVYDWEYVNSEARTGAMDAQTVTGCTLAFCQAVEAAGYEAMVYFNSHQADEHLILSQIVEYPFWLAMYTDRMTYPYKVRMWQYTDRGTVPGIEGYVDLNLWLLEPDDAAS